MMWIFWVVVIAICSFIIGATFGSNMALLYGIVPCCQFLAASLSGKAAEDFMSSVMPGERGAEIARLFFIFYKAGCYMENDPEAAKFFALSVDNPIIMKKVLKRWLERGNK